ncbi:MAG: GNAT family N-acyltransferase [Pseudomonadota bacterium]|nr:GNAT family N-acyltransferase [Pseudomonadota bacterium]
MPQRTDPSQRDRVAIEPARRLQAVVTDAPRWIEQAQALRHEVFLPDTTVTASAGRQEADRFDAHCEHLVVIDRAADNVVGYTRVLTPEGAARAGGYYSQTEFELGAVLGLPGRFIELGRTCIHPRYRSGATLAVLWQGVAQLFSHTRGDYLIGCGSIPLACGIGAIHAMIANITPDRRLPEELAVATRHPLPAPDGTIVPPLPLPPLLRTYLRVGARVSGQAYWDRDFDCADLFVLLPRRQLANRYARHFSVAA